MNKVGNNKINNNKIGGNLPIIKGLK